MVKRLQLNIALLEEYDNIIIEQERKGIVKKAVGPAKAVTCYLPHQAVVTVQQNTTKLRIVHDARAKASKRGSRLNKCLCRKPVISPSLCGILWERARI